MPVVIGSNLGRNAADYPGMQLFVVGPGVSKLEDKDSVTVRDISFGVPHCRLRLYDTQDIAFRECRHLLNHAGIALDRPAAVRIYEIILSLGQCMQMFADGEMYGMKSRGVCFAENYTLSLSTADVNGRDAVMESVTMNKWEEDFLMKRASSAGVRLCEGCKGMKNCFTPSPQHGEYHMYCSSCWVKWYRKGLIKC